MNIPVELRNIGLDGTGAEAVLSTSEPDMISIDNHHCTFGDMAHLDVADNFPDPFTFTVSPTFEARYVMLYFDMTTAEGFAARDSVEIMVGRPPVLLIDDDSVRSYRNFYQVELDTLTERRYDTWEGAGSGSPSISELRHYPHVIWYTAESTETIALDTTALKTYLDNCGSLFISG